MALPNLKELPLRNTPKGTARFPDLNKPDTKFKAEGEFKVGMIFDDAGLEHIKGIIKEVLTIAKAEATARARKAGKEAKRADLPVRPEMKKVGPEEYEATGRTVVNFKSTASGKRQDGTSWERKIPLFDAKGKPTDVLVSGGSTLRVAYKAVPWVNPKCEYGVKLQIEAVKVIELVQYGERSADAYGFDEEEEGYEAPEQPTNPFGDEEEDSAADTNPAPAIDEDDDF